MSSTPAQVAFSEAFRVCLRLPIPEITEAARLLDEAVSAHLHDQPGRAAELIRLADMPVIREWTESIWGSSRRHLIANAASGAPQLLAKPKRQKDRMPTSAEKRDLLARDGYHCRFCRIPVVRLEVRKRIRKRYPDALPWGRTNASQHSAFQAMWAQYDHVVPHSRGGGSDLDNLVISCAPCNFGRMEYTLKQVGLIDPLQREPLRSAWDGLERFR